MEASKLENRPEIHCYSAYCAVFSSVLEHLSEIKMQMKSNLKRTIPYVSMTLASPQMNTAATISYCVWNMHIWLGIYRGQSKMWEA